MNVLITGGNGFLGSNLVRKFLLEKHSVYVISNNTNNIEDILNKIKYSKGHTKDILNLFEHIKLFSPDIVLHLGWSGGNSHLDVNDIKQVQDNVEPGIYFLEMLSKLPISPSFYGFGSFSEYGNYNRKILETDIENPINLYGLSKYTFKNYSKLLCKMYGMDWGWIRPCYTYGPYDVNTRLIPLLIKKFYNNETVILDDCEKKLDYLYVEDFVNYVYELVINRHIGIFNICSGHEYRLKDVILNIKELTNSKSKIKFDSKLNREFISNYICGNNDKVSFTTNILPKTNLKTGLINTINYYKLKVHEEFNG
jgi:nucleoside-diphosphate-sugar epimerase